MNSGNATDNLNWAALTDKGTRKESNEDSHDVFMLTWGKERKPVVAMVVADGISATNGGGYASQVAVDTIKSVLSEPNDSHETTSDRMAQALTLANQEILFQARQTPEWAGMGTTVVLALLVEHRLYVMGLGDSRAYLIRNQQIHQLTTDHTWAQYNIDANQGESNHIRHRDHSRLLRYLGNPNGIHIDRGILSPDSKEKEEYIQIRDGDAVLLCSDGLYKLLSNVELNSVIDQYSDKSNQALSALISMARKKGEKDDISAVLLTVPNAEIKRFPSLGFRDSKRPPVQLLRFALAAVVALALVIFRLNYQPDTTAGDTQTLLPNAATTSAIATLGGKVTSVSTLTTTSTSTQTPTVPPLQGNGTIPLPPTQILPTVALPTQTNTGGN